jgi:hypothetical protein
MNNSFLELIKKIKRDVQEIKEKGISIESLDKAIEELETHSDNIKKIEDNIDSIREEVITPIRIELEQNKKAGKFSIYGLYVGATGLSIAIIAMILQFTLPFFTNSNKDIQSIKTELADLRIAISNNQTNIISGIADKKAKAQIEVSYEEKRKTLFQTEYGNLSLKPYLIWEEKQGKKWLPSAHLNVYLDDKAIGAFGLPKYLKIVNNSGFAHFEEDKVVLSEGDGVVFSNHYCINIIRIYRTKSHILDIADDKSSILIEYYESSIFTKK